MEPDVLLDPSRLPYGLPDFSAIEITDFLPAIETASSLQLVEVDAIANNPDPASFANTVVALDQTGVALDRALSIFFTLTSADTNDALDAIESELSPKLAAHRDAIHLNARLFARIKAVYDGLATPALPASEQLEGEDRYLVERTYLEFVLSGAALNAEDATRLRAFNERLAALASQFGQNLQNDTTALAVVFDSADELDGLSAAQLSSAATAARERGLDGKYVVPLVLYTGHPFLASLTRRESRERIMRASQQRGRHGGEFDNRAIVLEMVRLRAERAELLGFPSHAALVLADETAKTPEAVKQLLDKLVPPAASNAKAEAVTLQRAIDDDPEANGFALASWDWAYYTEKVRASTFSFDESQVTPYFELERTLNDGVFFAAHELYGLTFEHRPDLTSYHPDVRVFEVFDADGAGLGLFLEDFYARDSKNGGAWMNDLSTYSRVAGGSTIILNTHNIPKPADGEPTLLTIDAVGTLFHEFGHALHGFFGRTAFRRFAGTGVARDFVEFPSQVNEMWVLWPQVLRNFAKHVETGEPMPESWANALTASEGFNEGFATSEYLAAAILDQAWHRLSAAEAAAVTDVEAFERTALQDAGLAFAPVPTRYSSTYFQHTFSGGYDAGYYSYIWSEVLDADTVEWFREHGGLSRENGQRFRDRLLGVGGSVDPLVAYRDFRGGDASIEPLLRRRRLGARD